jgi:hypothetical protein
MTLPIMLLFVGVLAPLLGSYGCAKEERVPAAAASQPVGHKKVRIHFDAGDDAMSLQGSALSHAFIGFGAWRDGKPEVALNLAPGTNELLVPTGAIDLRATLISFDGPDAYLARATSNVEVGSATDELEVRFGSYRRVDPRPIFGLIYLNDTVPADGYELAFVDPHSGAELTLPQDAGARTDARGVFALKEFLGGENVRLRVKGSNVTRDLVLPLSAKAQEGHIPLPFVNLQGKALQSPFAIDFNLLKGAKGDKGDKGDPGAGGFGSGLLVESEPAGPNCALGGTRISRWRQAPGTASATFSATSGSSDLAVSYVCTIAAAPVASIPKIYQNGIELGRFVNNGPRVYGVIDGVHVPLRPDLSPDTYVVGHSVSTVFEHQLDPKEPALLFDGPNCQGTPYILGNTWLAHLGPAGSVLRAVDVSSSAAKTSVLLLSGWQKGSCKNQEIRSQWFSVTRFGEGLAFGFGGFDAAAKFIAPNGSATEKLVGIDVPFTPSNAEYAVSGQNIVVLASEAQSFDMMTRHLFRSTNGGVTWARLGLRDPQGAPLPQGWISFLRDSGNGVMLLRQEHGWNVSENGGQSWTQRAGPSNHYQPAVDELNNIAYASNGNEVASLDLNAGAASGLTTISLPVANVGNLLAGNAALIYSSYDGGVTNWYSHSAGTSTLLPTFPAFDVMACRGVLYSAEFGPPAIVKSSTNNGATWTTLPGVESSEANGGFGVSCNATSAMVTIRSKTFRSTGASWTLVDSTPNVSKALPVRPLALPAALGGNLGRMSTLP